MTNQEFKTMKKQPDYEYKAFQLDYNKTIVVYLQNGKRKLYQGLYLHL